jgi:hypothetical protein
MNDKAIKRLFDMQYDEVSLVDRPANQYSKVMIAKAYEEEDPMGIYDADGFVVDEDDLEHGDYVYDDEGAEYVFVDEDIEKGIGDVFSRGRKLLSREKSPHNFGPVGTFRTSSRGRFQDQADYVRDRASSVRDRASSARAQAGERVSAARERVRRNPVDPNLPPVSPERALLDNVRSRNMRNAAISAGAVGAIGAGAGGLALYNNRSNTSKSLGDVLAEELSKAAGEDERTEIMAQAMDEVEFAKAAAAEAWEAADRERDLRITDDFISKAAEYNVPVVPEVLGPILKAMAETLNDDQLEVIDALLTSVGDILFEEVGYTGENDNNSVIDQVNAYANEFVGKYDASSAQVVTNIFETNPEAYDAYLAENGRY